MAQQFRQELHCFRFQREEHAGSEWFVLTRDNATLLMKGMAAEYNLGPEKIGTHSIRISGATALLLA